MRILILSILLSFVGMANALVVTKHIDYEVSGKKFTGFMAYDDALTKKRPGILVVHEWWGHNDYARKRATMLAELAGQSGLN